MVYLFDAHVPVFTYALCSSKERAVLFNLSFRDEQQISTNHSQSSTIGLCRLSAAMEIKKRFRVYTAAKCMVKNGLSLLF